MREPYEMCTASRMQNMVQIREKFPLFRDNLFFWTFRKNLLGLSALRAPTVGLYIYIYIYICYHIYICPPGPGQQQQQQTSSCTPGLGRATGIRLGPSLKSLLIDLYRHWFSLGFHFRYFFNVFCITFLSIDFAFILYRFPDGSWYYFEVWLMPFPFAHSPCNTLVFEDPYSKFACSGALWHMFLLGCSFFLIHFLAQVLDAFRYWCWLHFGYFSGLVIYLFGICF